MAIDRFEKDEVIRLRGTFRTPKTATPPNVLIDPASVTLVIRRPDKTSETRVYGVDDITKDDVGLYSALLTLSQEGTYHWKWTGMNSLSVVGVKTGSLDSRRAPNF